MLLRVYYNITTINIVMQTRIIYDDKLLHRIVWFPCHNGEVGGQNRRLLSDYTPRLILFGFGNTPEQHGTGRQHVSPCKRRYYGAPALATIKLPNHLRATCVPDTVSSKPLICFDPQNRGARQHQSTGSTETPYGANPHAKTTSATEAGTRET